MSLYALARRRAEAGNPVRVALIGAGKFGSMFLNQAPTMPGVEIGVIADLDPERARNACRTVGWDASHIARPRFVTSGTEAIADPLAEVVVEATGSPPAGIAHARAAIAAGKHIVMVNVEADALAGPLLAEEARAKGVVYSLAYGDQPALTCEIVDWARACGFEVAAAGKGTKYLPAYHAVTPDDVWAHHGLSPEEAKRGGMNPQMFNSFLDGTKSAIEMAAIANATGLAVPGDGLGFPPCGVDDLPEILRGGRSLERDGMVEVVSCLERDGRPVFRDLRWGVYAVLKAPNDYARTCFREYGLKTDASGWYATMYKPYHLIGLELGMSVLSAALRGEPTGQAYGWRGDVVSVAKRALKAGETLDGEGGYTVWGKLVPAERSLAEGALPIDLAHRVPLNRDVAAGAVVRWADVDVPNSEVARVRRDMERRFATPAAIAAQ